MSTLDRLHGPIIDERFHYRRQKVGKKKDVEVEDILDVLVSLEDEDGQPLLSTDEIKAQNSGDWLFLGFSWTKHPGVGTVSLQESPTSLALAAPLVLQAKPRLAAHLYMEN
ncbi:unnamed protein product [Miscanthus lutarioriparius]|uniref:Uncharacterized protein n=1 Tax=Miscanthus lutarioriparius TaxID=422564 RepID=A0A811MJF5_9POAL|nr:unnamed protein product [Miscanthus lutarioriparius]